MDLGTANTIIISDDKIVVDEPSVVALDRSCLLYTSAAVSFHDPEARIQFERPWPSPMYNSSRIALNTDIPYAKIAHLPHLIDVYKRQ